MSYRKLSRIILFLSLLVILPGPLFSQFIQCRLDTFNMCPGQINVPVKIINGNGMAAISLVLYFDTAVIKYTGIYNNVNPGLQLGFLLINNNITHINLAWYYILPISIANDTLVNFVFNYYGGVSMLTWDSISCAFSDINLNNLNTHYYNGKVGSFGFTAQLTGNPSNVHACEGGNALFKVQHLFGQSFQWQMSIDGGSTWGPVPNTPPYTGVTNDTLWVTNITNSMNGYKYRCVVSGACPPNPVSASGTLTVQAAPIVNAGLDAAICQGLTYSPTGTASNYGSLVWSSSGTGTFTGGSTLTPVFTPSAADITAGQVYLILYAEGLTPCSAARDSLLLVIHPQPIAFAGNDTTICEGGPAILHAHGGNNYSWNTVPPQNTQIATVYPLTQTTYTVTVSSFGCSTTDMVTVSIQLAPTVNAGTDNTICAGQSYNLGGTSQHTSSTLWTTLGDGSFNNAFILTPVYTPGPGDIMSGLVHLILSGLPVSPCAVPVVDSVVLNITPLPNAFAGNDVTICLGTGATLTATGGTSFLWSTTPAQTTPSIFVNPPATTEYTVTVTDNNCSSVASVTVNVLPLPVIVITDDTTICAGQTILLVAYGGLSYIWSTGSISTAIDVTPMTNTGYRVTVTDVNGCVNADSVKVYVNASLQSSVSPAIPFICEGGSITLTASANHPSTYTWLPSTGLSNTTGPVVIASPPLTTAYSMTAVDGNGCISVTDFTLTVYQVPPVEVHPPVVHLCRGDTVTLTAYGANTYYWTPPSGLSSNNLQVVTASPKTSTVYELTGTDVHNCVSTVNVVVNVYPVPVVTLPESMIVCRGERYLLDGNGKLDSCTYQWQDGSVKEFFYADEPGLYYVKVNRLGCIVTDSVTIKPCSELWIPSAFTPNNDGVNDYFYVVNTGDIISFNMTIYNRWGEAIFHTLDVNARWDGTYQGNRCPAGVYHYVIEYLGQGNVLLEQEGKNRGQITLFR
ncbi:MAG: gliding motility-associated C-terminal domain-containing protein [Bacteroidetes bacterium]|nr:gliding motility-associated C-terminal domain-containing protein [Bacteroidota bacterium]